ncbi:protein virilizer-like isoform X2 [Homarus americanus]|uniref:protein virilizer-like isoform X2 n=1 Tax=Homarus americanus TaxID=6706 RepID=UPI001C43E42A|nr:protein virilizer-like isoform X2 [Homarus americanus]
MYELLFFDTFSHEVSEKVQLDLVQFPRPVQVTEVRAIPLGARVQADFPGGVRLGATNPSQFEIEFFVNDLSKRGAGTFESVGCLQYNQHGKIHMDFEKKVPTDGLLLRGNYNTITLAVYGHLTKVQREPTPPKSTKRGEVVPHPPPEKVNTHDRIRDWLEDTQECNLFLQRKQQPFSHDPSEDAQPEWDSKPPRSPLEYEETKQWDEEHVEHTREYDRDRERERERERDQRNYRGENRDRERDRERERDRDRERRRSVERSWSRERSWERSERSGSRRDSRRDSVREGDRERDRDREREKEFDRERDRERDYERERDHERDREKERDRERDREKERERIRTRGRDRERDRDRERERRHSRESREHFEEERLSTQEPPPSRGRHSMEEWDDRRSERSDRSGRRPRTPTETQPAPGGSPYHGENFSEEGSHGGTPHEYREREVQEGRDRERESREFEAREQQTVLPPLPTGEDMEAISDDEDLPDLPPETGEVEEEYPPEDCMEEMGIDETQQDEVEDVEGFGYEEIISDEEELPEYQYEEEWLVDEWEDWLKPFNPSQFQMVGLQYLVSPTLTDYQVECQRWKARFELEGQDLEEEPHQAVKLESLLTEAVIPKFTAEENVVETETGEAREEEGEKWVQAMEHVCQLLPKGLPFLVAKTGNDICNTLCDWVDIGLDFERALFQEQPVYKIRHIKAGVRLTQLMLQCSCDLTRLLLNRNIMERLYSLYYKPHMALSIKLLVLKTIDTITRTPLGLRFFLGESEDILEEKKEKNGYELILEMLADVPQTRAKVALSAIVRKVHLLEICHQLSEDTKSLIKHLPPFEDDTKGKEELNPEDEVMETDEAEGRIDLPSNWSSNVPDSLVQAINSCVREVLRVYKYADQLLAQPHRWLPDSKQFQLPKNPHDAHPQLYLLFDHGELLQSLAVLLGALGAVQSGALIGDVKSLLECMLSCGHGVRYMAAHPEPSTTIARSLTQLGEDGREEGNDDTSLHQLGMQMVHTFHALQQLDALAQLATSHNTDYSQAVVHFNTLTSLLLSPAGRQAITSLLSVGKNIEILFPYLKLGAGDDQDNAPTRLACYGYAVDLIVLTVKFSENVEMLEQYGAKLLELMDYEETREGPKLDEHVKLCEIIPWISIARSSENFSYDNLANLSNNLKDQLEKIDKFSGELVTHLRIIQYLTVPKYPVSNLAPEDHNGELIEELKYKYATVQLFSADCHTHLTNLLTKLCSMYSQPSVHSSNFTCSEGAVLLAVIQPTLILLKNILTYVIQARNTNFKDLSAIVPLVQTYLLLQSFPMGSQHYNQAQDMQQEVISILLVYTQPVYSKAEGEEVLAKSLWTKMMAEIFKYLLTGPHTFTGVISLVIELLPLPLPIQTRKALSDEESSQIINLRKLWSAHLYCLSANIHEIIIRLGVTSFPPQMHLLRRMCIALSDLAAPMALLVGRATLDLVLQAHRLDQRAAGEDFGPCSLQTGRVLNMLALLVSHAPTKAAVLHLLRGGTPTLATNVTKGEDKYTGLVALWCRILNVAASGSHAHMQAQDCIISIIQYLCDHENAMHVTQDSVMQEGDVHSNTPTVLTLSGVPNKDTLIPIVDALIDHLRNLHSSHQSIQQVLRALMHLMEHDYGFYHIKSVMEKKRACLISLFKRLSSTFRKESHEHITSLQGALEFCQLLIMNEDSSMSRTMIVSASELANYLGWKPGGYEMQFSKYSQDKKDIIKKEEKEKEKVVKEEPVVEEPKAEKEETPEKENEVEVKQEEAEVVEEKKEEIKKEEVKKEEVKKEEPRKEEETQERIHPLKLLESQVVADGCEEEMMESLYDDISQLITILDQACLSEVKELSEPVGPEMETLQSLFASRVVWTITLADDEIPSFWLVPPVYEDADPSEMVPTNLLETCRQYAGEYDLLGTLHKLVKGQGSQALTPQKLCKGPPRYKHSAGAIRPDKRGRPFVAPMRGRSFNRGVNMRSDPFRSRPPNTSRPPSLHVDDFVALESTGHQPTGPTGYNKISFGRGKVHFLLDSMRGRGSRGRGDSRGSRFFHRPPFRPDCGVVRGMNPRGRGMPWIFRGDGSPRGYRGVPLNPGTMRFMRGRGMYMRGNGVGNGPKDRFPSKFVERGGRRDMNGGRHMRGGFR